MTVTVLDEKPIEADEGINENEESTDVVETEGIGEADKVNNRLRSVQRQSDDNSSTDKQEISSQNPGDDSVVVEDSKEETPIADADEEMSQQQVPSESEETARKVETDNEIDESFDPVSSLFNNSNQKPKDPNVSQLSDEHTQLLSDITKAVDNEKTNGPEEDKQLVNSLTSDYIEKELN